MTNENMTFLIKSTEKLFQVIKQKMLKLQMIDAGKYLREQIDIVERVKSLSIEGKITEEQFQNYMNSVSGLIQHIDYVYEKEGIWSSSFESVRNSFKL